MRQARSMIPGLVLAGWTIAGPAYLVTTVAVASPAGGLFIWSALAASLMILQLAAAPHAASPARSVARFRARTLWIACAGTFGVLAWISNRSTFEEFRALQPAFLVLELVSAPAAIWLVVAEWRTARDAETASAPLTTG